MFCEQCERSRTGPLPALVHRLAERSLNRMPSARIDGLKRRLGPIVRLSRRFAHKNNVAHARRLIPIVSRKDERLATAEARIRDGASSAPPPPPPP